MIEEIQASSLLLVARRWSQRGMRTDLDHFFNFFPGARIVSTGNRIQRPYFLLKKIRNCANQESYNSNSAGVELRVMLEILLHRPRLVHFWFADHEYHFSWLAAKLVKAKIVGNFFFSIEEFQRRIPDKRHLRHLDLVTASGKKQLAYLEQFIDPRKLAYLPLGIDTGFFSPPANPEQRWSGPPVLLHVGENRRDIPTLKKVYLELKTKFRNLHLELVGGDFAKPHFKDVEDVLFHPFLSDDKLLETYRRAAVLILPLLEGASSQSLNEALATGLPVVTNNLPNLQDYATEPAVHVSPAGDACAMAGECEKLFKNPAAARRASLAARTHAEQFDFSCIRKRLVSLYEEKLKLRIACRYGALL